MKVQPTYTMVEIRSFHPELATALEDALPGSEMFTLEQVEMFGLAMLVLIVPNLLSMTIEIGRAIACADTEAKKIIAMIHSSSSGLGDFINMPPVGGGLVVLALLRQTKEPTRKQAERRLEAVRKGGIEGGKAKADEAAKTSIKIQREWKRLSDWPEHDRCAKIADKLRISPTTVRRHLAKAGLKKTRTS